MAEVDPRELQALAQALLNAATEWIPKPSQDLTAQAALVLAATILNEAGAHRTDDAFWYVEKFAKACGFHIIALSYTEAEGEE